MRDSEIQAGPSLTFLPRFVPQQEQIRSTELSEALQEPEDDETFDNYGIEPEPKPDGDLTFFTIESEASKETKTLAEMPDYFSLQEPIESQMCRFNIIKVENSDRFIRIMKRGELCVQLAKRGDLQSFQKVVQQCPKEEMLYWFVVNSFKEACSAFMANIVVFMLDHGLDLQSPILQETLHGLVEASTLSDLGLIPMIDLLVRRGLFINHQRKQDYKTALHLACEKGLFRVVKHLLYLDADVNAVAKDDIMPLHSADLFVQSTCCHPSKEPASGKCTDDGPSSQIHQLLFHRGAKRTWRQGASGKDEPLHVRFIQEDAQGVFSGGF